MVTTQVGAIGIPGAEHGVRAVRGTRASPESIISGAIRRTVSPGPPHSHVGIVGERGPHPRITTRVGDGTAGFDLHPAGNPPDHEEDKKRDHDGA